MTTTTTRSASTAQIDLIRRLLDEREITPEARQAALDRIADGALSMAGASDWIDRLFGLPQLPQTQLDPGIYEIPTDTPVFTIDGQPFGEVYRVKWNRAKTNLYATRMVGISGDRLTEAGTVESVDFTYAPGVVARLRGDQKMTAAKGELVSVVYGRCIACGRTIWAAASVLAGMGPVCRGRSFRPADPQPATQAA